MKWQQLHQIFFNADLFWNLQTESVLFCRVLLDTVGKSTVAENFFGEKWEK